MNGRYMTEWKNRLMDGEMNEWINGYILLLCWSDSWVCDIVWLVTLRLEERFLGLVAEKKIRQ